VEISIAVHFSTMLRDDFAELVERRRLELGLSMADLAERAFGSRTTTVVQDLKRGRSPSIDRAKALCEVLGLEFYLGPVREELSNTSCLKPFHFSATQDLPHIGFAKCGIDGWADATHVATPVPAPDGLDDPDAFYVTAKGQSMMPDGIRDGFLCLVSPATPVKDGDRVWIKDRQGKQALKRLVRQTATSVVLRGWQPLFDKQQHSFEDERYTSALEAVHPVVAVFRQGDTGFDYVPDPQGDMAAAQAQGDLRPIRLHDVQASAGPGQLARDGQILSEIGFPEAWLARHGISPSRASLIYIDGESMAPTITNGAMVLVDHNRTTLRRRRIYAFRQGEELFVKRLEKAGDQVIVLSDNPDHETRLIGGAELEQLAVLGEVVWSGKDWI
jgi:phage repressor protein C with HTH and peptisase S24 domain